MWTFSKKSQNICYSIITIEYKHIEHENVDFINQYYRIIYSPNNNVGVLINSFCVSLCKNINDENDIDDNIRDLNDIIFEIGSRMNNKYFDDNYIPSRCKIVFTSFKPLHSTIHYDPIVESSKPSGNNGNNGTILPTVQENEKQWLIKVCRVSTASAWYHLFFE